ncbi:MAG: rhomboid family intramembrane serine protease [Sandaracinaceae bacterium]|nr:rhomboid family intramembrane serine protease [Sandaracinaceae bacterium]
MRRLTKRAWVTPTIVAINVALFAVQVGTGVDFSTPSIDDLLTWGANYGPLTMNGELWRLFTACFLHIGVMHIAFNMFAMWRSGVFVEQLFGNVPFLVLYLVAGLGGSVVSLVVHNNTVSAGASGAIFGIFGGLAGYLARNRNTMPKSILRSLGANVAQIVVLNIAIGFLVPRIDVAAHGGGLVIGAIAGFALAQPMTEDGARKRVPRAILVLLASAALLFAGTFALPKHGNLLGALQQVQRLDNEAVSLAQPAAADFEAQRITPAELVARLTQARAKWEGATALLDGLSDLSPEELGLREKYRQYCRLRVEQADATMEYARTHDESALTRAHNLLGRIEAQTRAIEQANQDP